MTYTEFEERVRSLVEQMRPGSYKEFGVWQCGDDRIAKLTTTDETDVAILWTGMVHFMIEGNPGFGWQTREELPLYESAVVDCVSTIIECMDGRHTR